MCDPSRLTAAVALLEDVHPENRLLQLENLATNNGGQWECPETQERCLYSVNLFGIYAMAETREELPLNWLKLARQSLAAPQDGIAA